MHYDLRNPMKLRLHPCSVEAEEQQEQQGVVEVGEEHHPCLVEVAVAEEEVLLEVAVAIEEVILNVAVVPVDLLLEGFRS